MFDQNRPSCVELYERERAPEKNERRERLERGESVEVTANIGELTGLVLCVLMAADIAQFVPPPASEARSLISALDWVEKLKEPLGL